MNSAREKKDFDTPSVQDAITDDTPIWRYMDLPRFVSMLASDELWFTKAATCDDPNEGFCKIVPSARLGLESGGLRVGPPEQVLAEMRSLFAAEADDVCGNARDHLYVNSWCLEFESMAIWEIYATRGCGLAVRSSVGQYRQAARFDVRADQYDFGKVTYDDDLESSVEIQRDFRSGALPVGSGLWPHVLKLSFHKHSCYRYENEWRAALAEFYRPEIKGVPVKFDMGQLISAVYVGPRADNFFYAAVKSIMNKFRLRKPLERSGLLRPLRKETTVSVG
jgi:hypothetical protein